MLSAASVYLYTQVPLSNEQMLVLGFPLGFAASGIFSGIGAYLTELFPSSVRATGQGFAYNFGRGIGALFPSLVGFLSQTHGLAWAIGAFATGAYVMVILTALLLRDQGTRAVLSATRTWGRRAPAPSVISRTPAGRSCARSSGCSVCLRHT